MLAFALQKHLRLDNIIIPKFSAGFLFKQQVAAQSSGRMMKRYDRTTRIDTCKHNHKS